MIHVCFGLYDKTGRYSKFTGTTILSMFDNTISEITVHILHDDTLTQDNREKFIYLAGRYNQTVKFYNVDKLCADELDRIKEYIPAVINTRYTIATFYRFLLPEILSTDIEKIIYLDSDIVVNLDIRELWKIELNNKAIAALPETEIATKKYRLNAPKKYIIKNNFVRYEDYFNAGVLVMNLNYFRVNDKLITDGLKFYGEHPKCKNFDQDILNWLFSKDYVRLPAKFNRFVPTERLSERKNKVDCAVYHYEALTLSLDGNDPFNRLWMKYFIKTPWFNEDTIARLYEGIQEMHIRLKGFMIKVSTIMKGKTRAFFVTPDNRDALKKNFSIEDDEEIILDEDPTSLQKLLHAMHISRGKKVFFIFTSKFPFDILIQAGFKHNTDFVNGFEFLSEANGLPMNSYSLIQTI